MQTRWNNNREVYALSFIPPCLSVFSQLTRRVTETIAMSHLLYNIASSIELKIKAKGEPTLRIIVPFSPQNVYMPFSLIN